MAALDDVALDEEVLAAVLAVVHEHDARGLAGRALDPVTLDDEVLGVPLIVPRNPLGVAADALQAEPAERYREGARDPEDRLADWPSTGAMIFVPFPRIVHASRTSISPSMR